MNIIFRNKKGFTIWELLIIIAIIGILAAMAVPNHPRGNRSDARKKACFSNMRVLAGAIEMYNMDVCTMMRELNDDNQKLLIEGKYLKSKDPYVCPESYNGGKYVSIGDITEDGTIYCTYHGTIDGVKIKSDMTYKDYKAEKERMEREEKEKELAEKRKQLIMEIGVIGGIVGFVLFIIVLAIPQKKNKKD